VAFQVHPVIIGTISYKLLQCFSLRYDNPLTSARALAIRFWQVEVNPLSITAPTDREVVDALSDLSFRKRWAARVYLEATRMNYDSGGLITNSVSPEGA